MYGQTSMFCSAEVSAEELTMVSTWEMEQEGSGGTAAGLTTAARCRPGGFFGTKIERLVVNGSRVAFRVPRNG